MADPITAAAAGLKTALGKLSVGQQAAGALTNGEEEAKRILQALASAVAGVLAFLLLLLAVLVALVSAVTSFLPNLIDAILPDFGGGTIVIPAPAAGIPIPEVYWPVYIVAAAEYKVNPYLIASIHMQETGFSTNPTTKAGRNSDGCCAGPMQFNLDAGTWDRYKNAFRDVADKRPDSYPLNRRDEAALPSCANLPDDTGCIYDDFDAVAAAGKKLAADGADWDLGSDGTRRAAGAYIGSEAELENCSGPNAYCGVIGRAQTWEEQSKAAEPSEPTTSPADNGLLAWPVPAMARDISSPFGMRQLRSESRPRLHAGIDLSAPMGTPLTAADAGRVGLLCHDVQPCRGYGEFVCIDHRPDLTTCYAHLSAIDPRLRVGAPVARGQRIGVSGNTGHSTAPHLHFEVRRGPYPSTAVNPVPWLESGGVQ